jgi:glutaredoxin-related protein
MERIQQQVDSAAVVLYMKGTPQFPQCGFSATAAQFSEHLLFQCAVCVHVN